VIVLVHNAVDERAAMPLHVFHVIAAASAMCPSKPSELAMPR
jgi:hypothetical protein